MSSSPFQVAVIGGGPAGSTAARVLARAGISVLLAAAKPAPAFKFGESLVPAAQNILKEIGLWETFQQGGHTPCFGNCSAWGSALVQENDFIRSPYGHGWHLDRAAFDQMLWQGAVEAGATAWVPARLESLRRCDIKWGMESTADEGKRLATCEWVIDATGRQNRVAATLGITRRYEDKQVAFFARFLADPSAEPDQDSRTLVESIPQGWIHTARLPDASRIVTVFTDAGTPWIKRAGSLEGFLALVGETRHVAEKLLRHGYAPMETPQSTDARSSRLERFHGDGWIAAGDAATAFDPLSSQGILSALYGGLKAAQALVANRGGDGLALDRYDKQITNVYEAFLANRLKYYGEERRWPDSPYWAARSGQPGSQNPTAA